MLLAFDTATHAVTVALHQGSPDGEVLAESTVVDALRHGELLAPGIQRVLEAAGATPRDLTRIAVGVGPGPFTGLRVGIVTARTMAAVLEIPVVGVCTLDVVAAAVTDQPGGFRVATDARRKEVYWATYDGRGQRLTRAAVDRPADVAFEGAVAGRGPVLYPDAFPHAIGPENPSAADLARLVAGQRAELLTPEPLYLRRPDAVAPGQRKRVL
jgi:tRNA threonylcarbamoyl adenosine modification protein YeaZ